VQHSACVVVGGSDRPGLVATNHGYVEQRIIRHRAGDLPPDSSAAGLGGELLGAGFFDQDGHVSGQIG
jgi:hypothetical protein